MQYASGMSKLCAPMGNRRLVLWAILPSLLRTVCPLLPSTCPTCPSFGRRRVVSLKTLPCHGVSLPTCFYGGNRPANLSFAFRRRAEVKILRCAWTPSQVAACLSCLPQLRLWYTRGGMMVAFDPAVSSVGRSEMLSSSSCILYLHTGTFRTQ